MNRKGSAFTFLLSAFFISIICLTTFPVLALQSNRNISSYGSVKYPTAPALGASAIWCHIEDLSTTFLDRLETGKIFDIFMLAGDWGTDNTIDYGASDLAYANFITTAKNFNPNFRVHAWVCYDLEGQKIDISTTQNRQTMFNAIASCLSKGFDGFHDDLEPYMYNGQMVNIVGSWQDYVDYLNGVTATCHSVSKLASAAVCGDFANPPTWVLSAVTMDYVAAMLYSNVPIGTESDFKDCVDKALSNSASPVILGVMGNASPSLSIQLSWVSQTLGSKDYEKFAGVSLFEYRIMNENDWTSWNNWTTKGS